MKRLALIALITAAAGSTFGCRGQTSTKPPLHLISDMDWQPKYHAEGESTFFADRRSMRSPVEGTVARGHLQEDDTLYRGVAPGTTTPVVRGPLPYTPQLIARGHERFNIFCSPCHDRTGAGHGMVVQRGFHIPTDFHSDRLRGLPDGEIFQAITRGVRNMPAYANQIPVEDRWAIISWVRVLQRSQHASIDDVPAETRGSIEPEGAVR